MFVDPVDRDARLPIARFDDGPVHPVAVHALAPVPGQQGRMHVQNPASVGPEQIVRHEPQESGQHDVADPLAPQSLDDPIAIIKGIAVENFRPDAEPARPFEHRRVGTVRQDQRHAGLLSCREIRGHILGIRPRTGGEHSYLYHKQ